MSHPPPSSFDNQSKIHNQPQNSHESVPATINNDPTQVGSTIPMGYPGPTGTGYPPPYPQPYPPSINYNYNNASQPYYNPYAQPAPPYQPYPPPAPDGTYNRGGSNFVRGFLATIITLIVLTCVASIITWLILRPEVPVFRVETLSVSDFNLTGAEFSANWAANLTSENPNRKLKIYMDQILVYVYHDEDFLASSVVDPTFLPTKAKEVMPVSLKTNNTEQHMVARWVVDDMAREKGGGGVSFNLRLLVSATFKSGSWWTRHATMKVFCDDLRVGFVGNETSGVFVNSGNNNPKHCQVYYN